MSEQVAMFRGRPCTELTREELIEAYTHLSLSATRAREFYITAMKLEDELRAALAHSRRMA